jgi:hypothetical protein
MGCIYFNEWTCICELSGEQCHFIDHEECEAFEPEDNDDEEY